MSVHTRLALLVTVLLALVSCVSFIQPDTDATVSTATVEVEISFATRVCGDFRVELDGRDVTAEFSPQPPTSSNPRATFTELSPGQHTLLVRAEVHYYWLIIPFCSGTSETLSFNAVEPSLGFSPAGPITLPTGGSQSVRITLNPSRVVQTDVTLSSSAGSVASISPQAATITAGQVNSDPAQVEALAAGTATIRASAPGTSSAELRLSVVEPDFTISVSPQEVTIPWGSTATYTVSVESLHDFTGNVELLYEDQPEGSIVTITPDNLTLTSGGSAQATLRISTLEAATEPGTREFRVVAAAAGVTHPDDASIRITRTSGAFGAEVFPLITTSATCGADVEAEVTASGAGPRVVFTTPLGTASEEIAGGYDFSSGSKCRGGLVIPPVVTRPAVIFYNFQFPPVTGADSIGSPLNTEFPVVGTRFSPDDSIAVVYGDSGNASPRDYAIFAVDLVEGEFSSTKYFDDGISSVFLDAEEGKILVEPTEGYSFEILLPWL